MRSGNLADFKWNRNRWIGNSWRKPKLYAGVFMLIFGTIALLRTLGTPRLAALHGSDVAQLLASGALFGTGLVSLIRDCSGVSPGRAVRY
jgi:hypothetical protein